MGKNKLTGVSDGEVDVEGFSDGSVETEGCKELVGTCDRPDEGSKDGSDVCTISFTEGLSEDCNVSWSDKLGDSNGFLVRTDCPDGRAKADGLP